MAQGAGVAAAVMNGTTSGPWTTVPAASIKKGITISGLTPMLMYGLQVQALGVLGYSDWSTPKRLSSIVRPSLTGIGPMQIGSGSHFFAQNRFSRKNNFLAGKMKH